MKMTHNEQYVLGWDILAAMGDLNSRLQQEKSIQLALRIGIHTGLVVVGEMGGQDVKNSWHWVRHPILLPGYKDWLRPIPWRSARQPIA